MDWLIDPDDRVGTDRVLAALCEHLVRHAADARVVDGARNEVRRLLEQAGDRHRPLWLHLDWKSNRPWAGIGELADPGAVAGLGLQAGDLVPVEHRARLGDPATLEQRAGLAVERRLRTTYPSGPPPMADLDVDPRRDGPAAVAVALAAAAEAHPGVTAPQLAALAGAALADGVLPDPEAKPDPARVADLVVEAHRALGSDARLVRAEDRELELVMARCPFGTEVASTGSLCHVSAALAGRLAAHVQGEATVVLEESIASGDQQCHLRMYLGEAPDEVEGEVHRWPVEGVQGDPAPHLDLSLTLPRESGSVPVVRRVAAQALTAFGVVRADLEDVQLAITEACANVIDHAGDTDTYEVKVELASDECAITVIDQGSGFDATLVPTDPDPRAEDGRGLALMRALVDNVAFRSEPRAGAVVHMVKSLRYDRNHPLWRHDPRAGTYEELTGRQAADEE